MSEAKVTAPKAVEAALGAEGTTQDADNERIAMRAAQQHLFNAAKSSAKAGGWNEYGKSDSLVGPGTGGMAPGPMSMAAKMKLHSRLSINLFRGRQGDPKKNVRPIIGLARFARQVALVWTAATQDDPFADQTLINIEAAYETADKLINTRIKALADLIDEMEEFEVDMQASEKPVDLDLKFYSPWGFRGALLLKAFDKLVRMALTARHLGLFAGDDWQNVVHDSQRALRHMFVEVDSWVSTGVTRTDMDQDNRMVRRAQATYTELKNGYLVLDSEVMQGRLRAKLSPPNKLLAARLEKLAKAERDTTEASGKPSEAVGTDIKLQESAEAKPSNRTLG